MQYPKELHRYFSFDRGLETLNNQQLYLATFFSYNDPQEILPASIDLETLLSAYDRSRADVQKLTQTEQGVLEIRLGLKTSKDDEDKIIQVRNNLYPRAAIKKAKISKYKYQFDYEEL